MLFLHKSVAVPAASQVTRRRSSSFVNGWLHDFRRAGLHQPGAPLEPATVQNVDRSMTIRPGTHSASGSLYGVSGTHPADVTEVIAPLRPVMFNNPTADVA